MPRKQSLLVCVALRPSHFTQNRLRPTPTIVRSKVTPRSTPSGHSKTSADHFVYGSPHGRGRR